MRLIISAAIMMIGQFLSDSSFASHSTSIGPRGAQAPQSLKSYVDTEHCSEPIRSNPYVLVLGTGGTMADMKCPVDRPVMYGWRQELGFGSVPPMGMSGGGFSWITCCAVSQAWYARLEPKNNIKDDGSEIKPG